MAQRGLLGSLLQLNTVGCEYDSLLWECGREPGSMSDAVSMTLWLPEWLFEQLLI